METGISCRSPFRFCWVEQQMPFGAKNPFQWPQDLYVHQRSDLSYPALTKLLSCFYNDCICLFFLQFILLAQDTIFYWCNPISRWSIDLNANTTHFQVSGLSPAMDSSVLHLLQGIRTGANLGGRKAARKHMRGKNYHSNEKDGRGEDSVCVSGPQPCLYGVSLPSSREKFSSPEILSLVQKVVPEIEIYFVSPFSIVLIAQSWQSSLFLPKPTYGLPVCLGTRLHRMTWWYQVC